MSSSLSVSTHLTYQVTFYFVFSKFFLIFYNMKPILIDDLMETVHPQAEFRVTIDDVVYSGWKAAKPLNYNKEYTSHMDKISMCDAIMRGKAIAVRFFEDLTEEEQVEYAKEKF